MKAILRFVLFAFLACAALVAIAVPFVLPGLSFMQEVHKHPSDAVMIAHWREHRAVFERLTEMLREDPALKRLAQDFVQQQERGLSEERIVAYRALMKEAGVISLSNYEKGMSFLYSASGWSIAGSGKSYVFGGPADYAEQVEGDLDKAAQGQRNSTWQRLFEARWRLELDKS